MARAAVKAKQQAKAKAQPAKAARSRGRRRRGSGGGNPNQQLFFMKLRRGQRWLYLVLALVFAATFAGVGVGSGTNGLSQLYSGIFGGGGNAVSKAQGEIKKNPAKGYLDLATAYETKSDNVDAISAFQSYLKLRKRNATVWQELGFLQTTQAGVLVKDYQAAQQAAQLADPSQPFQASGVLGEAIGTSPVYSGVSQQASSQATQLLTQATSAYSAALQDFQQQAKLKPRSAQAWIGVANAAQLDGQPAVELGALKRYLKLDPKSPQRSTIVSAIKQLEKTVKPAKPSHK